MSKKKNVLKMLTTEKKVTNWKMHKRKKVIAFSATVVAVGLGVGGLVYAGVQGNSVFPTPPTDTTVNWSNNSDLAHIVLQDGTHDPLTKLTLGDGTPVYCLGLGVPLTDNSTTAQQSAVNALWNKLSLEQQAIINNVAFLSRQGGDDLSYAAGRLGIYQLLDSYGVSTNQATGIVTEQGDKIQDASTITQKASDLISQAQALRQLPSFNNTTVQVVQGVDKVVKDTKGVLPNFPYVQNSLAGVTANISGNDLKLQADITTKHGLTKGAIKYSNVEDMSDANLPWFIYSTNGDDSGTQSQTVMATKDPSHNMGQLSVNIIGLGEATLTKADADTGNGETQGAAQLKGAVFGLFNKSDNSPVKWSAGQDGYPITLTAGTKVDSTNISIKLGDDLKAGVKNLDNSKEYYWKETVAPEGYSLSTAKYEVKFDSSSKFDDKTSNYIDNDKATDKVLDFNFGFIKAQDVNGSLTGLNGRTFRYTPTNGTKGEPIEVTSGSSEDSNGVTNNGQVNFTKIPFGDGLLEELPKEGDTLQLINPISIVTTTNKDKDENITGYTVTFTDTVTKQVITTLNVSLDKVTDNSTMFKVNLGTLVDKPITPVVPTIKTKAHDKNNKQTLAEKEISKDTVMYDDVELTNAKAGQEQTSTLHRRVKDDSGKVKDDKVVATAKATFDDKVEKSQENTVETKVDTTKDTKLPDTESAEYVWTQEIKQDGKVIAKHDDLDNQDETIYVPKGHTQVATNEIEPKPNQTFPDNYYAKGLTIGETYTVKVISAWDNQAKKEVPAKGELTFKATATSMTVQVPVTIDASDLAGHDVTLLEELHDYSGNLNVSNKDKNDKKETVHVKDVTPTPSSSKPTTPSTTPATPKAVLPTTGSSTGDALMYGGMAVLLFALGGTVYYMKKKKSVEK